MSHVGVSKKKEHDRRYGIIVLVAIKSLSFDISISLNPFPQRLSASRIGNRDSSSLDSPAYVWAHRMGGISSLQGKEVCQLR